MSTDDVNINAGWDNEERYNFCIKLRSFAFLASALASDFCSALLYSALLAFLLQLARPA